MKPIQYFILGLILALTLKSCARNERNQDDPKPEEHLIARVLMYRPAPGQFVNKMPNYITGDTEATMIQKALTSLRGGVPITLGGFGGYVTIALGKSIPNHQGADFVVLGNSFLWDPKYNPNPKPKGIAASSEPGIVQVAYDANSNSIPDEEEWYELAGSEDKSPTTRHGYSITYSRVAEHMLIPGTGEDAYLLDTKHVAWQANDGTSGFLPMNQWHKQSYYPQWIKADSYTLQGTSLASHIVREENPKGGYFWTGYAFAWGYADNMPNDDKASHLDISWAVDKNRKPVDLPAIHFVRIYTGMHALAGVMGEVSTEVSGIKVLP